MTASSSFASSTSSEDDAAAAAGGGRHRGVADLDQSHAGALPASALAMAAGSGSTIHTFRQLKVCVWGGGAEVCMRVRACVRTCCCLCVSAWACACVCEAGGGDRRGGAFVCLP